MCSHGLALFWHPLFNLQVAGSHGAACLCTAAALTPGQKHASMKLRSRPVQSRARPSQPLEERAFTNGASAEKHR